MGSYLNAAARPAPSTRAFSVEAGYERGEHVHDDGQPEGTTITDPATGEVVADPEAYLASSEQTTVNPDNPVAANSYVGPIGFPNHGIAQSSATGESVNLNSDAVLVGATFTNQSGDQVNFSVESGIPEEAGQNLTFNVDWGRWAAANFTLTEGGTPVANAADYHYIYARRQSDLTTTSELAALTGLGTATYSMTSGTTPTDQTGSAVPLNALSMTVDFANQNVDSVNLEVDGFSLTGSTSPGSLRPNIQVTLSDTTQFGNASGQLTGQFLGTDAGGAMVVYGANDSDGTSSAHGAALLER
jgi:hypothetical protein